MGWAPGFDIRAGGEGGRPPPKLAPRKEKCLRRWRRQKEGFTRKSVPPNSGRWETGKNMRNSRRWGVETPHSPPTGVVRFPFRLPRKVTASEKWRRKCVPGSRVGTFCLFIYALWLFPFFPETKLNANGSS